MTLEYLQRALVARVLRRHRLTRDGKRRMEHSRISGDTERDEGCIPTDGRGKWAVTMMSVESSRDVGLRWKTGKGGYNDCSSGEFVQYMFPVHLVPSDARVEYLYCLVEEAFIIILSPRHLANSLAAERSSHCSFASPG
jgi:hypothetical protein